MKFPVDVIIIVSETFGVGICLCRAGAGKQVGQRVEASHGDPEAGVPGVGHQTAPGPAEIQRQQQDQVSLSVFVCFGDVEFTWHAHTHNYCVIIT